MGLGGGLSVTVTVVEGRDQLLPALLASINHSGASQVFVTGKGAGNLMWMQEGEVRSGLGSGWAIYSPHYGPTAHDIAQVLEQLQQAIRSRPEQKHVYIGPGDESQLLRVLDAVRPARHRAAVYVISLHEDQLAYLSALGTGLSASDHIECIFTTADSLLSDEYRSKLQAALGQPEVLSGVAWEYMQLMEKFHAKRLESQIRDVFGGKKWWQFWR